MSGNGCPNCANYGFNSLKPAVLYFLLIEGIDGRWLQKVGITSADRGVDCGRYSRAESQYYINVAEYEFKSGREALNYENEIKEKFNKYRCEKENYPLKHGFTEAYDIGDVDIHEYFIDKVFINRII